MESKKCNVCGLIFTLDGFFNLKSGRLGKTPDCKKCRVKTVIKWRKENPDKSRPTVRRWYKKHSKEIMEKSKAYWDARPIKKRAVMTNAKAKRRGAVDKISVSHLEAMLVNADWKCQYCGNSHDKIGFDHRTPLSRGGRHIIENMIVSCLSCNHKKKSRNVEEFKEYANKIGLPLII